MKRKVESIDKIPESKIMVSNENEVEQVRDPHKFYPSEDLLSKNQNNESPPTVSKEDKEAETSSEEEKEPLSNNPKWGMIIAGVFVLALFITVPKVLSTMSSLGENGNNNQNKEEVVGNRTENSNSNNSAGNNTSNNNENNNANENSNTNGTVNNGANKESNSNSTKNKLDSVLNGGGNTLTEEDVNNRAEIQNKREKDAGKISSIDLLNAKIINNLSSLSTALQNQSIGNQSQFGIQKDRFNVTLNSLNSEYDKMVSNREMTQAQADILGEKLNISKNAAKDIDLNNLEESIEVFNDHVAKFNALEDQFQNLK